MVSERVLRFVAASGCATVAHEKRCIDCESRDGNRERDSVCMCVGRRDEEQEGGQRQTREERRQNDAKRDDHWPMSQRERMTIMDAAESTTSTLAKRGGESKCEGRTEEQQQSGCGEDGSHEKATKGAKRTTRCDRAQC
jgi:hypothetical protein